MVSEDFARNGTSCCFGWYVLGWDERTGQGRSNGFFWHVTMIKDEAIAPKKKTSLTLSFCHIEIYPRYVADLFPFLPGMCYVLLPDLKLQAMGLEKKGVYIR